MKKFLCFLLCCAGLFAEENLLSGREQWIPYSSRGGEKVSFSRKEDVLSQSHADAQCNGVWHTGDIPFHGGDYILRVEVKTDGVAEKDGGAYLVVQSHRTVPGGVTDFSPKVETDGRWQLMEYPFHLQETVDSIRIWLGQTNYKGTTAYRNVELLRTPNRSPYVALRRGFLEDADEWVDLLPGKPYRLSLVGAETAELLFTDQDGQLLLDVSLRDGERVLVPVETMRSRVKAVFPQRGTICLEQIADDVEGFDWRDWNAWAMRALTEGPSLFRRVFPLEALPAFAVGRIPRGEVWLNQERLQRAGNGYYNLRPKLQAGENCLEVRFPNTKAESFSQLAADIHFRYMDGSEAVILGSDGLWETRGIAEDAWKQATLFAPSWYDKTLFQKEWIAPEAMQAEKLFPVGWRVETEARWETILPKPGEPLEGTLRLRFLELPYFDTNRLKLEWVDTRGEVVWVQWIFPQEGDLRKAKTGDVLALRLSLATKYLRAGKYTLRLDRRLSSAADNLLARVTVREYHEEAPTVELVLDGSVDVIRVNGRDCPVAIYYGQPSYATSGRIFAKNTEDDFHLMTKAGYQLFNISILFGADVVKHKDFSGPTVWTGEGEYDLELLDRRVQELLSVNPDAYIILLVNEDVPAWWLEAHPDEGVVWDNGERQTNLVSLASRRWQEDTAEVLRVVGRHIREATWGNRVIGWYAVAGYDGQWFQPMQHRPPFAFCDYSPMMREYFRDWLRREYDNDAEKWNRAWGTEGMLFENTEIPSRAERTEGKAYYLNPVKDRAGIDFLRAQARLTDDVIGKFLAAFSEGVGRPILGGTYFIPSDCTYVNGQAQRPVDELIYDCKEYHFAASPLGYDCHGLNQNGTGARNLKYQRLNGRLFIGEDDTRTFRSQPFNFRWGNPTSFGTLAGMRRNFAQRLTNGGAHWYFDMYGHWYDTPSIQKLFRQETAVMGALTHFAPLPQLGAQAASVKKAGMNLNKRLNTSEDLHQVHFPQKTLRNPHFAVDQLNWRSLSSPNLPAYKLFLLNDSFALDEEDRNALDSLKRDGNVLVFEHAFGYSDGETLSAEHISAATGIHIVEWKPEEELSDMTWVAEDALGELQGTRMESPKAKRFVVDDQNVEVLGRYEDGSVAAAIRRYPDWTAVYLPAAFTQGEVLDAIGKLVGVHVYSELPVNVCSGGRCVSVYCPVKEAVGVVSLPERFCVYEVFGRRSFFDVSELPIDLSFGETRLFFLGTREEIQRFAEMMDGL